MLNNFGFYNIMDVNFVCYYLLDYTAISCIINHVKLRQIVEYVISIILIIKFACIYF